MNKSDAAWLRTLCKEKRGDIRPFIRDTPFPTREEAEESYQLSNDYRRLFARVLEYARETVMEEGVSTSETRAVVVCFSPFKRSGLKPAAAAATLRMRAQPQTRETTHEADDLGRRTVLDLFDEAATEANDVTPGSDAEIEEGEQARHRRRLLDMAAQADALSGAKDEKLRKSASLIEALIRDGFKPIVFCRSFRPPIMLQTSFARSSRATSS